MRKGISSLQPAWSLDMWGTPHLCPPASSPLAPVWGPYSWSTFSLQSPSPVSLQPLCGSRRQLCVHHSLMLRSLKEAGMEIWLGLLWAMAPSGRRSLKREKQGWRAGCFFRCHGFCSWGKSAFSSSCHSTHPCEAPTLIRAYLVMPRFLLPQQSAVLPLRRFKDNMALWKHRIF